MVHSTVFANQYMAYKDPVTYSEALNGGNSEQWIKAKATEVQNKIKGPRCCKRGQATSESTESNRVSVYVQTK